MKITTKLIPKPIAFPPFPAIIPIGIAIKTKTIGAKANVHLSQYSLV